MLCMIFWFGPGENAPGSQRVLRERGCRFESCRFHTLPISFPSLTRILLYDAAGSTRRSVARAVPYPAQPLPGAPPPKAPLSVIGSPMARSSHCQVGHSIHFFPSVPQCRTPISAISHRLIPLVPCSPSPTPTSTTTLTLTPPTPIPHPPTPTPNPPTPTPHPPTPSTPHPPFPPPQSSPRFHKNGPSLRCRRSRGCCPSSAGFRARTSAGGTLPCCSLRLTTRWRGTAGVRLPHPTPTPHPVRLPTPTLGSNRHPHAPSYIPRPIYIHDPSTYHAPHLWPLCPLTAAHSSLMFVTRPQCRPCFLSLSLAQPICPPHLPPAPILPQF